MAGFGMPFDLWLSSIRESFPKNIAVLSIETVNIPVENIIGLGNGAPQAKSN